MSTRTSQLSWGLSAAAGHLPRDVPSRFVEVCREADIHAVEAMANVFGSRSRREDLSPWASAIRAAGIQVPTFHLIFEPQNDLANFYETERRRSVEEIRKWIEASVEFGSSIGILHPTSSRLSVDVEGLDRYVEQLARSCEELLPTLRELDYRLAVENMLPGPAGGRFGSRPEHFERIARVTEPKHVGFCLDTGHALVASGSPEAVEEFFDAMGERLIAVHLADNAGDRDSHLAPGHGHVDWPRVFRGMERLGFHGHACVETPPFAPGPEYSAQAWREHLAGVRRLAEDSLAP